MRDRYDAIIIGSGFGGGMTAHALVNAGWRVLLIERGAWVERGPHNWGTEGAVYQTPHYSRDCGFVVGGPRGRIQPGIQCVGGQSVFFGGVSLRMREDDFNGAAPGGAGRWPFGYAELEPSYARAERILGVVGDADTPDPTAPPRSGPFPANPPTELSAAAARIRDAARALGLRPFRLPLAMNHVDGPGRDACVRCLTCDAFACAVGAKNDVATAILPDLVSKGLTILPDTRVLRLTRRGAVIEAVECVDVTTGEARRFRAEQFVLAAGALASPQLVLESGLEALNGDAVGRYLVRHCSAIVYALFRRSPNPDGVFHKEIGIHDFYPGQAQPGDEQRLGAIQQVHSPPVGLASSRVPAPLRRLVPAMVSRMTGLLVLGMDSPRAKNRVFLHPTKRDPFGARRPVVRSRYSRDERRRRRLLVAQATRVLRAAGGLLTHVHPIRTYSHAVGTLRMGDDPRLSVVDHQGRFRGIDNLTVADASALPNTGAVNPSLTISATALYAADALVTRGAG